MLDVGIKTINSAVQRFGQVIPCGRFHSWLSVGGEKESAKSFSELLFKFLWTHKKINVCAVEGFTSEGKEFILNSEFVFKNGR